MIDFRNYRVPTIEEERERLLSKIPNNFYKDEGSIFYDVMSVLAQENTELYKIVKDVFENSFGLTATGEYLDWKCNEVGIERKIGIKAKGTVKFIGNTGTKIPFNSIVLCDELQYITLIDTVIGDSREAIVEVEAIEIGAKYNVLENRIDRLGIPISGIESVTNETAFINGTDTEADDILRKRYLEKVREQSTSGNAYHYKQWTLSVDGIGQAKIYPLWNGAGTVKVIVISSTGNSVSNDKLEEVKRYIEQKRPIGADVTVVNAIPKIISISATIQKNSIIELDVIKKQIINQVNNYLSNINLNGGKVSYGKISSILYDTNGIQDYSNFRLNNGTESISIEEEQIAVLGDVILNV